MSYRAETVLQTRTELGEGALWDPCSNVLLWVDITGGTVYRYDPETGENRAWDADQMVGTVVVRKSGGIVCALQDRIAVLDTATGEFKTLVGLEEDEPGTRCNDGKCDPAGRLWVGTMGISKPRIPGCLYSIDAGLNVTARLSGVGTSNGIIWSEDEKVMYYIDTPTSAVDAFDYDVHTGNISNRRHAVEVPPEYGHPDGMTIDENGNIWVAMWGGQCVRCWDPKCGKLLETVEVPGAKNITSCAFGDSDLDTLYITTAQQGTRPEEKTDFPEAGNLFAAKVGVKGVPSAEFEG